MGERKVELPVTQKLLDRIVRAPQHLVVLETANVGETIAQMRTLAMRGGTSVYVWNPESGTAWRGLRGTAGIPVLPPAAGGEFRESAVGARTPAW